MANYYPLISKAVAGLEKNTGEGRRVLYERARNALVTQLRSVTPALSESDITRERLALEEAIRKVEAEAARRARPASASVRPDRSPTMAPARPGIETPPRSSPAETDIPAPEAPSTRADEPRPPPGRAPLASRNVDQSAPTAAHEAPGHRPAPWQTDAGKPYRADHEEVEPGPPPHSEAGDFGADPNDRWPPSRDRDADSSAEEARPAPAQDDQRPGPLANLMQALPTLTLPKLALPTLALPKLALPALAPTRSMLIAAAALLIALGVAGLAFWQWPTIAGLFGGGGSVTTRVTPEPSPSPHAKITDRIGAPPGVRPQTEPAAAQRVVLYEEDPSNASGRQYVGTAIWRTEAIAAGPGQATDVAVRAEIEIPEPKMTIKWSFRRNSDKALPASHTIEIMFTLPPDFPNGGIANIPGILMKQAEQTRGVPLAGLAVKVTNGFFLIGLSSAEADVQRNIQLLKERAWFDVPVIFTNGHRAIMAIEKGAAGERVFADAFAAWGE